MDPARDKALLRSLLLKQVRPRPSLLLRTPTTLAPSMRAMVTHIFTFTNTGDNPLILEQVQGLLRLHGAPMSQGTDCTWRYRRD